MTNTSRSITNAFRALFGYPPLLPDLVVTNTEPEIQESAEIDQPWVAAYDAACHIESLIDKLVKQFSKRLDVKTRIAIRFGRISRYNDVHLSKISRYTHMCVYNRGKGFNPNKRRRFK